MADFLCLPGHRACVAQLDNTDRASVMGGSTVSVLLAAVRYC